MHVWWAVKDIGQGHDHQPLSIDSMAIFANIAADGPIDRTRRCQYV
jgi:hypothetical protein